ncbi:hypothetical protein, partial [Bradyrhizobium sp. AS23.2]|uniref:hypothetical protein n=1 Tax=Bradyrhizobium sp. AS23.2 TaxID=1680155 RepID=UPI00095920DF
ATIGAVGFGLMEALTGNFFGKFISGAELAVLIQTLFGGVALFFDRLASTQKEWHPLEGDAN